MTETMYESVGGATYFEALVDRFYEGVASDPLLRPLYPEDDLTGAKKRLCGFLIQYWGGPDDYSRQRGHPRLKMRHAPFAIGIAERDAWMSHMTDAVLSSGLDAALIKEMLSYFEGAATHLINHIPAPNRPDGATGLL